MIDSDLSEMSPETSESFSEAGKPCERSMSSVVAAQNHMQAIIKVMAPFENWTDQVTVVHRALADPKFPIRLPKLTWNRVKSWLYAEARRMDWEEIEALKELRAREEARREHREFTAYTNRLAAALASEGASLSRKQMAVLARIQSRSAHLSRPADAGPGIARRYVAVSGRDAA